MELRAWAMQDGDPYRDEMEQCVGMIMDELTKRCWNNHYSLAYQSRVGPVSAQLTLPLAASCPKADAAVVSSLAALLKLPQKDCAKAQAAGHASLLLAGAIQLRHNGCSRRGMHQLGEVSEQLR